MRSRDTFTDRLVCGMFFWQRDIGRILPMGLLKVSYIVTLTTVLWVVLTTLFPNIFPGYYDHGDMQNKDGYLYSAYYNSLNTPSILKNNLTDSHILLFTAHPDDESMFFTPTITELTKENYNNTFHLICLSNGGYDGLGSIRERELRKAARVLSIDSVKVLDYVDDINVYWNISDIVKSITDEINNVKREYEFEENKSLILLTFDQDGVSSHPNHKSVYQAVKTYNKLTNTRAYSLKSWNILVKYSGMLFTNIEVAMKWLAKCDDIKSFLSRINISLLDHIIADISKESIAIYSDLNSLFLNFSTMTWVHFSQIVWFRWIWIFSSKYMNSNELVPIS